MINEQQTQQVIDMIQSGVNGLSESMGVALPHLWEVLIRQQYVEAVQRLIFPLILVIAVRPIIRLYKHGLKESKDSNWTYILAVISVLLFALVVLSPFMIGDAIGRFVNPEYYAIQDIAEFIRGSNWKK